METAVLMLIALVVKFVQTIFAFQHLLVLLLAEVLVVPVLEVLFPVPQVKLLHAPLVRLVALMTNLFAAQECLAFRQHLPAQHQPLRVAQVVVLVPLVKFYATTYVFPEIVVLLQIAQMVKFAQIMFAQQLQALHLVQQLHHQAADHHHAVSVTMET